MINLAKFLSLVLVVAIAAGCNQKMSNNNPENKGEEKMKTTKTIAGPPVMVYKTKADYFSNVPVTLSDDKSTVVAFPGIRDVKQGSEFTYPTKLANEYLLDNRGVSKNTAFISLTYEEYHALSMQPAASELYEMIIDQDPFTELYHCGSKYDFKNVSDELNALIESEKLQTMKRLK